MLLVGLQSMRAAAPVKTDSMVSRSQSVISTKDEEKSSTRPKRKISPFGQNDNDLSRCDLLIVDNFKVADDGTYIYQTDGSAGITSCMSSSIERVHLALSSQS